jgi:hypothetical protein
MRLARSDMAEGPSSFVDLKSMGKATRRGRTSPTGTKLTEPGLILPMAAALLSYRSLLPS